VKFHFHTIISKLKTGAEGTKSAYAWLSLSAEKLTSFQALFVICKRCYARKMEIESKRSYIEHKESETEAN
jgi:hypothetical protein